MPIDRAPGPDAGQTWDAAGYEGHARFVADLGAPVVAWLDPRPGERILDLGAGDGALTARIAALGASALAADASAELLEAAAARGLETRRVDGQSLPADLDGAFDAVFTNAALHWMPRAGDVVDGVARALKPGGRFVGEFGGRGNVAAIVTALVAVLDRRGLDGPAAVPWYFPAPDAYRALLESRGFRVDRIELMPRPTPLPTGIEGWLATFADPFLRHLPDSDRPAALAEAARLLAPALRDPEGRWTADYVRLRFAASLAGRGRGAIPGRIE